MSAVHELGQRLMLSSGPGIHGMEVRDHPVPGLDETLHDDSSLETAFAMVKV